MGKLLEFLPFGKLASLAFDFAAQPVKDWLSDIRTRRAFENAVKHACRAFDARHPELSDEFFDGVFIEHNVAPLLAEFLNTRGQLPSAERIVEIWASTYHRPGQEARMLPYAAEFIREVGRQIVAQKMLRPYVDQGQLDRAVGLFDEIRATTRDLASSARRVELEDAFALLMGSALKYRLTATLMVSHADPLAIETQRMNAELDFRTGRMRLQRMEYVAAASLLADFEQLIELPFSAIEDALARGSGSAPDVSELDNGIERLETSLRDAP